MKLEYVRIRRGEDSAWTRWHLAGPGGETLCGSLDVRGALKADKSTSGEHRGERLCKRCARVAGVLGLSLPGAE